MIAQIRTAIAALVLAAMTMVSAPALGSGYLQCAPFARMESGIQLFGNARDWWGQAAGRYERGNVPQVGAVMAFASTRKMPMGHVAVVSGVVSPREILIDHANWKRNQVSLGMSVMDISEAGDWSSVKVAYDPGQYGRAYPISGFIYPASVAATPVKMAMNAE